jgi:hypothetical protein
VWECAEHLCSDEPGRSALAELGGHDDDDRPEPNCTRPARRGIAIVGLLAAALIALVIAPASTASAGRNSSAVKVHNLTKDATLVVAEVLVDNSYRPYWEEQGTPVNGRVVEPGHLAHYELVTEPGVHITADVDFVIRDSAGKEVGKLKTWTNVDGTGSLSNYGKATNPCVSEGPFTCVANGTDTITVRDREYFVIANRTSKLTFVIDTLKANTTFEAGGPVLAPDWPWVASCGTR